MKRIAFCGALGVATIATAAPHADEVKAYQALVQQDVRVATIGYRLASANAPFCRKLERNPGWVLQDERQYPDLEIARTALTFRQPVAVTGLVAGGPAEKGGVSVGDGLLGLNGAAWNWSGRAPKRKSAQRIEDVQAELRTAFQTNASTVVKLDTQMGPRDFKLDPAPICASSFWIDTKSKLDAGADGYNVRITEALVRFAANDDELAAAVAHELSHNLLEHRAKLRKMKKSTANVRATEIEADRLSVWLMANAGYDPAAALRFIERFGRATDPALFSDGTHLRWGGRVEIMQEEISKISRSVKVEGLLHPPLLKELN
jgi:beta-barrel assembly-enhancing protease